MRIGLVVAALALAMPVMAQRVRVQDTLYLGNGQKARGRVEISWPSFRTATGEEVAAGRTSFNVRDGVIDVQLYPTEGAAPAGVAYTATYSMTGGVQFEETWTVRASAGPLALRDVRATSTLTVWLGQLAQGGAAVNQCLIWNGTAWAPGACASGAGASAVWGAITGTLADQADLADALAGKAAAVHTHAIGDVAALQAALDGKSNTGHGHIIANVSGLQAALDAKESAANKGQPGGYAELGPDGKVPASQVPAVGGVDWGAIGGVLANQVDLQTALDSRSLVGHTHAGTYEPANANIQAHIANMNNPHGTTAAQVGASPVGHNHDAAYAPVDDPRLSDARTPLAHAASHAAGQADAITPAVIGAMSAVAGSGVVKVVGGAPALVTGSAADCVRVDGSSGACGTGGGSPLTQSTDTTSPVSVPTTSGLNHNDNAGAVTYNLPPITQQMVDAMWQRCFDQAPGRSGVITLQAPEGVSFVQYGVVKTPGGTAISGGSLVDESCVTAISTTHLKFVAGAGSYWTLN